MTSTRPDRTGLFQAPPSTEADESGATTPRLDEEALRRLRNPFQTVDEGTAGTGHPADR
jgi:hypothetical protein